MRFADLLDVVGEEPVFDTGLLLAGGVDPLDVKRQLSRWRRMGLVRQLRRGLYALASPYLKVKPDVFLVANRLVRASYVSLESALAFYGLVPEYVPVVTSVTTGRPGRKETPLGSFDFHHIKMSLFWGYEPRAVTGGQAAFIATQEKALLDLLYLRPRSDSPDYLRELRLQNLERLDSDKLKRQAELTGSEKVRRAAARVEALARAEAEEFRPL